jgi:hypothetical protein
VRKFIFRKFAHKNFSTTVLSFMFQKMLRKTVALLLMMSATVSFWGCANKAYPCPDNSGDVQISTKRGDGVGKLRGSKSSTDKNGLLKKRKKYTHSGL